MHQTPSPGFESILESYSASMRLFNEARFDESAETSQTALAHVYKCYSSRLLGMLRKNFGYTIDIEDVLHDTYIQFHKRVLEGDFALRSEPELISYLNQFAYNIASNKRRSFYRYSKNKLRYSQDEQLEINVGRAIEGSAEADLYRGICGEDYKVACDSLMRELPEDSACILRFMVEGELSDEKLHRAVQKASFLLTKDQVRYRKNRILSRLRSLLIRYSK